MKKSNKLPQPDGSDPLLDEIRAIKQAISAQFNHDVVQLGCQLQKDQEAHASRLVRNPRKKKAS